MAIKVEVAPIEERIRERTDTGSSVYNATIIGQAIAKGFRSQKMHSALTVEDRVICKTTVTRLLKVSSQNTGALFVGNIICNKTMIKASLRSMLFF